jgi:hypothetical protein
MLYIEKGASASLIFTLQEKSELVNPRYIFLFVNDSPVMAKTFSMVDISGWTRRYDEFILTETATEDLYIGDVSLGYGWGDYSVYETTATQSLDIANTTGRILEKGRFYVSGYTASYMTNTINNIYQ